MYFYTVLGKGTTHTCNLLVKRNIYVGTRWTYDYLAYCCQSYTNKCHLCHTIHINKYLLYLYACNQCTLFFNFIPQEN